MTNFHLNPGSVEGASILENRQHGTLLSWGVYCTLDNTTSIKMIPVSTIKKRNYHS
jgi:hypothetical protein